MRKDETIYSNKIAGEKRNYNLPVCFDMTGGFLGITQDQKGQTDRILLSPAQVKEMITFIKRHARGTASK